MAIFFQFSALTSCRLYTVDLKLIQFSLLNLKLQDVLININACLGTEKQFPFIFIMRNYIRFSQMKRRRERECFFFNPNIKIKHRHQRKLEVTENVARKTAISKQKLHQIQTQHKVAHTDLSTRAERLTICLPQRLCSNIMLSSFILKVKLGGVKELICLT